MLTEDLLKTRLEKSAHVGRSCTMPNFGDAFSVDSNSPSSSSLPYLAVLDFMWFYATPNFRLWSIQIPLCPGSSREPEKVTNGLVKFPFRRDC